MTKDRVANAIMAWHASPYDFQKFGPMKEVSGKGQGAASYGRGAAYVAESPKVSGPGESEYMKEFQHHDAVEGARRWQVKDDDGNWSDLTDDSFHDYASPEALFEPRSDFGRDWVLNHLSSDHDIRKDPGALDHLRSLIQNDKTDFEEATGAKHNNDAFPSLARYMNESSWQSENGDDYNDRQHAKAVADYLATRADKELRHVSDQNAAGPFSYRVAVHLKPENMLDWDEPLSGHHPEAAAKIENLVRQHYPRPPGLGRLTDHEVRNNTPGSITYSRLVSRLGSDFAASEALHDAGIHGIRYKDGQSRNLAPGEKPTYNYVIFHPDFVEALQQYDLKGNLVKEFGPGVHLKAVDHDPFKDEHQ